MMLMFQIEQIAICPRNPAAAEELLTAMGAQTWVRDTVTAHGEVYGMPGINEADLAFNYELAELAGQLEFEILHYRKGPNWMATKTEHSVSHLGMHCTVEELAQWKEFFRQRGINIAQEVVTSSHTNPVIAGKRCYCYCVFDTRWILGVDIKLIVRIDVDE